MESWIDESKLNIFKPRLGKCMLAIGGKFYSSSSANARIAEMTSLDDVCRLRIRPTTSSSTYGYIHIRRHVTG